MVTFAICEDESWIASDLKKKVEEYLKKREQEGTIQIFARGEELLDFGLNFNVILMDIKLSGRDGMKIAKQLKQRENSSQIIFITAFRKYVFQAFDLDAVHYILKPVNREKLEQALDKAIRRVDFYDEKALLLVHGDRTDRIFFKDILYCEVFDHQLFIYTTAGDFKTNGTLEGLEKKLDERFFRSHRSYLINLNYVVSKDGEYAIIAGGKRVLVSRRKQQELTKKLMDMCRN